MEPTDEILEDQYEDEASHYTDTDSSSWETEADSISDEIENEDDKLHLCSSCQALDLSKAFSRPFRSESEARRGFTLCTREKFQDDCALCRALEWSARNLNGTEILGLDAKLQNEEFELRVFPVPQSFTANEDIQAICAEANIRWLHMLPATVFTSDSHKSKKMLKSIDGDQYFSAERRGWLACFPAQLGSRIWTPRPIPETFAPQLARQWLASCCKHHSNRCRNALARPTNLVVIDCKDLVVVPCPDAPYVALSYVWGSDRDEETGNTLAEYDLRKPSNTVKDAIDITTRMGYRYLWVDQFCINQSNVNIQREQIERMDMVYQGAYFTIVAAAGEDQRHGIAGASAKRKHQFVLNNGDVTVIEMPPETPYESVWSTRAWTFQEGLLSPRRLLFTETHAFFICRESYCSEAFWGSESMHDPQIAEQYPDWSTELFFTDEDLVLLDFYSSWKDHSKFDTLLEKAKDVIDTAQFLITNYTAKAMTFQADALRAFAAIQRVFEQGDIPLYGIQGLQMPVISSKSMSDMEAMMGRALAWQQADSMSSCRRSMFPSWTWAGWTGEVMYPLMSPIYGDSIWRYFPRRMSFGYRNGSTTTLKHTWKLLREEHRKSSDTVKSSLFRRICSLTNPLSITFRATLIPFDALSCPSVCDWKQFRVMGMSLVSLHWDEVIPIKPHELPFYPRFLMNGISSGTLGCILLGCEISSKKYRLVHLLLVQWSGERDANRIGKLTAFPKTTQDPLEFEAKLRGLKRKRVRLL